MGNSNVFLERWIPDVIMAVGGMRGKKAHTSELIPVRKGCSLPSIPYGTKSNSLVTHIDTNGKKIVNMIFFISEISQCFYP